MDNNKLDTFSKILLATGQINYMAASLNGANEQNRMLGSHPENKTKFPYILEAVGKSDEVLQQALKQLSDTMEFLGNHINAIDCICEIDVRVAKVPFEIIVHGKDNVDEYYESAEKQPKEPISATISPNGVQDKGTMDYSAENKGK